MTILQENFKWHLEAFASELFKFNLIAPSLNLKVSPIIFSLKNVVLCN